MEGWIKLHRKFIDWEWFTVGEMVKVFIYLILSANHEDGKWQGIEVKRGQLITGINSLSKGTKLTIQTLRTCLKRLESTGEINIKSTNKYSIITICKYNDYQFYENRTNNQTTNKQQTNNKQLTTNKKEEEIKNEKNTIEDENINEVISIINNSKLSKIQKITDLRKKHLKARISENGFETVKKVFIKAISSDFLTGVNDKNWKCDFDWIVNPNNFVKILENKYDNKPKPQMKLS